MKNLLEKVCNKIVRHTQWYDQFWNGAQKFWNLRCFNLSVVNLGSNSGKYAFNYEGLDICGMNWALGPQSLVHDFNILKNYFSYLKSGATVIITLCPFSSLVSKYSKKHNLKYYTFLHPATIIGFKESERIKALKINTKNADVNIYHYNSELPEIVGYKGNVFEIPNARTELGLSDKGQASFKICDLQIENLLSELNTKCTSTENIETLRKIYKKLGYDKEILKILDKLLDERAGKIKEMESCKTIEELNSLINSYPQNERLKYFNAMESQRNRILLDQFFNK